MYIIWSDNPSKFEKSVLQIPLFSICCNMWSPRLKSSENRHNIESWGCLLDTGKSDWLYNPSLWDNYNFPDRHHYKYVDLSRPHWGKKKSANMAKRWGLCNSCIQCLERLATVLRRDDYLWAKHQQSCNDNQLNMTQILYH